mmetsp:Transcript_71813/g.199298  ORF Transcript_71813/g.199298 Transcript_71813/m.199298 type:complete len:225 (+) Transcript_71813:1073-1747(+)
MAHPRDHKSLRLSLVLPVTTSGDKKLGTPTQNSRSSPTFMGATSGWAVSQAVPKPISLSCNPSTSRKFSHLMSRCTMPAACTAARASTICLANQAHSPSKTQPQSWTLAHNSPPGHKSKIPTHCVVVSMSQSMETTSGDGSRRRRQWASMAQACSRSGRCFGTSFIAYSFPETLSVHRKTLQNDPLPSGSPRLKSSTDRKPNSAGVGAWSGTIQATCPPTAAPA